MVTPEQIHDALSLLPEELLEPVDALRRRKRRYWKPVAATVACLVLVVGLWFLFPGGVSNDTAEMENGMGFLADSITQESQTEQGLYVAVTEVHEDYLEVTWVIRPSDDAPETATVYFDKLEEIPQFAEGQKLRIYCEATDSFTELYPYRITIEEN